MLKKKKKKLPLHEFSFVKATAPSFLFFPQKETINFFRESFAYEEYECRTPDKECFYGGSKRYRRNMEKGRTIQVRKNKASSVKLLKEIEKHTEPVRPGRQDKRTLQAKGFAGFAYRVP